jgi:predicted Zn-ribbon and HTH transcriptional regulator
MDEDVVRLLKSSTQPLTVKEIVAHFKSNILQNTNNKDQIRDIMRRVLNHDKSTGKVTLKKDYL